MNRKEKNKGKGITQSVENKKTRQKVNKTKIYKDKQTYINREKIR